MISKFSSCPKMTLGTCAEFILDDMGIKELQPLES